MTNLLTKYPDVQGVMAANDSMALGIVKALDAAGKSGKVQVVGFDNIPAVQPLLQDGKMLARSTSSDPRWRRTPSKSACASWPARNSAAGSRPLSSSSRRLISSNLVDTHKTMRHESSEFWDSRFRGNDG